MVDLVNRISGFLTTDEGPKLLLHVTSGAITPPPAVEWMKVNVMNLNTIHLGEGAHFVQEDYPNETGTALTKWVAGL